MPRGQRHERDLVPVTANHGQTVKVGGVAIRESLLVKMRSGIDAGLAFPDAAEAAGIPYTLVLAALTYDDEMRAWYRECSGRKSLIREADAELLPQVKSPAELRKSMLQKAFAAGLGDKIAETIAHIEPIDPETGDFNKVHLQVLSEFSRHVLSHLPREMDQTNRDGLPEEKRQRTEQEVMQELIALREERMKRETAAQRAIEARSTGGRSLKGPLQDGE